MQQINKKLKCFTLVELIVVIVILAVLAVISFMTISGWIGKSKDSRRKVDLTTIQKGLEVYRVENSTLKYPEPDNTVEVKVDYGVLWRQGIIGSLVVKKVNTLGKLVKDPDNVMYEYSVTKRNGYYQVMAVLENGERISMIDNVYAKDGYAHMVTNYPGGIILMSGTKFQYYESPSMMVEPKILEEKKVDGKYNLNLEETVTIKENENTKNKESIKDFSVTDYFQGNEDQKISNLDQFKDRYGLGDKLDSKNKIVTAVFEEDVEKGYAESQIYLDCAGTSMSGFTFDGLKHGESDTKTRNDIITNGTKEIKLTAMCDDGEMKYTNYLETLSCGIGYVPDENQCVANLCAGDMPENSELNGTQKYGESWTYSEIAGECKYRCVDGYHREGGNCVLNSKANQICEGIVVNGEYANGESSMQITQNWDGISRQPTTQGIYSSTVEVNNCNFRCKANYTRNGTSCVADTRGESCSGLISNASWNTVSTIIQTWNGSVWLPTIVGTYNATSSTTECRYKCNTNYAWDGSSCVLDQCGGSVPANAMSTATSQTYAQNWTYNTTAGVCTFKCNTNYTWNGTSCVADTRTSQSCSGLPANAAWNTASTISQTWNGSSWLPTTVGTYNTTSSTSECRYKCNTNYTWDGSVCVADTRANQICSGLISNASWNTVSTISQTWNGSSWLPTTVGTYNATSSTTECRYKCSTSYAWNGSACVLDQCGGSVPANAVSTATSQTYAQNWTYNTTAGVCTFKCNTNYTWNGTSCVADTRTSQSCSGLPANAAWNTASTISQTWNGSSWLPTIVGTYNTSASTSECRYKCNTNYTWNGTSCVADTRTSQSCSGLPANAVWNTASTISQTWNGSSWLPTTVGTYNTSASTSECRYKCNTNYTWNGSNCVADTRANQTCSGLISNASWNTASTISQTWNGSSWLPTTVGTYNPTSSTTECRYKCNTNYAWNGSACVLDQCGGSVPANAVSTATSQTYAQNWTYNTTAGVCTFKCNTNYTWNGTSCVADTRTSQSCSGLPANAAWNTASTISQTWNGSSWLPTTVGTYNATSSTSECRYKCNTNYTWNGSSCILVYQSIIGDNISGRTRSNNTYAISCNGYKNPTSGYIYTGNIGDGFYRIDTTGGDSSDKIKVYCDMTIDGGGYTLVLRSGFGSAGTVGTFVSTVRGGTPSLTINGNILPNLLFSKEFMMITDGINTVSGYGNIPYSAFTSSYSCTVSGNIGYCGRGTGPYYFANTSLGTMTNGYSQQEVIGVTNGSSFWQAFGFINIGWSPGEPNHPNICTYNGACGRGYSAVMYLYVK